MEDNGHICRHGIWARTGGVTPDKVLTASMEKALLIPIALVVFKIMIAIVFCLCRKIYRAQKRENQLSRMGPVLYNAKTEVVRIPVGK